LAHHRVVFPDEIPEFGPKNLETLRQPLEDKVVTISRAQGSLSFPANFMLVGSMNPCPCGWFGDTQHECTCNMSTVGRYQKRLSGPLLDRIGIHVEVPRVDYEKLSDLRRGEPSKVIRARVEAARKRQRRRFVAVDDSAKHLLTNADTPAPAPSRRRGAGVGPGEIREFCPVDDAGHSLLRAAMRQLNMSARAYPRTLCEAPLRSTPEWAEWASWPAPHLPVRLRRAQVHGSPTWPARSLTSLRDASHSGSRRRIWSSVLTGLVASAQLSLSLQRHRPIVPHRLCVEARQHARRCQQPDIVHTGPALYVIRKT